MSNETKGNYKRASYRVIWTLDFGLVINTLDNLHCYKRQINDTNNILHERDIYFKFSSDLSN